MRVEEAGKYLRLYREDGEHIVASRFLGWRQEKGKPYVTVENNMVNNILLGRDVGLRWAIFSIVTQWV